MSIVCKRVSLASIVESPGFRMDAEYHSSLVPILADKSRAGQLLFLNGSAVNRGVYLLPDWSASAERSESVIVWTPVDSDGREYFFSFLDLIEAKNLGSHWIVGAEKVRLEIREPCC